MTVVWGPSEREPESRAHVTNPRLVIEVLSPSTEESDRGEKLEHYRQVAALEGIVLVDYQRRKVQVWARASGGWEATEHSAGATIELRCVGCSLSAPEVFAAVDAA